MSEIITTHVNLLLKTEESRKKLQELNKNIEESKDAIINLRKENINYSKELSTVTDKHKKITESIKKLEGEEKTNTKSYQKKIEIQKQLQLQIESIRTARDKNTTSIKTHTENIDKNNLGVTELKKTLKNTELTFTELTQKKKQLEAAFKNTDPKTDEYKLLEKQLYGVTKEFNKQSFAIKDTRCSFSQMADTAHKYFYGMQGAYNLVSGVLNKLITLTQEYLTLSDKFSDVQKTTGLSTEAVRELDSELQKIDTRTSRQALLDLATDAGKLGISGKEDVLQFVKAADQIKVALGEDLGEGAIRDIGKMADVFGLTKELGIEQSYLKIGSAINELGQSSSASESYLVDFTQRLSGVAAQSGISIENILGYASALDQSGQAVEVSATTMQNFIMKLFQEPSKLAKLAKLAGKDVKDFTELLKTDANQAIKDILTSLNTQGGFSALVPIFDQLGLDGARSVGVFFIQQILISFFLKKKVVTLLFTISFTLKTYRDMEAVILQKAKVWLSEVYDEQTRKEVQNLIDGEPSELSEAFYRNLEFGTGGLRGIIGVGTNRMNVYTVAIATQGFANYIKKSYPQGTQLKVAIACDSRHKSSLFSEITARVFAANDFKVYLFMGMRPTPELSFAVRHFNCCAGVMITASHNPKEYNGYKAYWSDGGQLVAPHDSNVIKEVEKITDFTQVKLLGKMGEDIETAMKEKPDSIEWIGIEVDNAYLAKVKALSLSPQAIAKQKNFKMVYTPLHGTGATLVPRVLRELGFESLSIVADQAVPDGDFPTVKSPNPEEKAALQMAIDQAKYIGADLVMATDPDADRVGIAVRSKSGEYLLLNGNQTASVLIYYLLNKWKELGRLTGKEYIVKTIVTTELLKDIAERHGVKCYDVLTGFKFIAEVLKEKEGEEIFIGGGEESYGYLVSDFVRDKDAVIACCMIAEMAADAACQGKSFIDILETLYKEYGFYKEGLFSLTKKGKSGIEEIQQMMNRYRTHPPKEINGSRVLKIYDYKSSEMSDCLTGSKDVIKLPKSDVLQFFTEKGDKVTIRPSGTEPKIKFYFGVKAPWIEGVSYEEQNVALEKQIEAIVISLGLRK